MDKANNIVEWQSEAKPLFGFDNDVIAIDGQPADFDFSMVIAVYNAEKYVAETIDSLIAQDFGIERIQIVLVDDGSTDASFEVCKSYAEKYPENIVLIHKANGGVSSARNVGMRYAKGKYINFIDSDDLFSANTCTKVFEFFKKYESKTDVVTVRTELFGAKQGDTWFNRKFDKGDRLIDLWKDPHIYLNSTSFTFFHSRIRNQLVFDEELCISEDLKVVNSVLMNKWTIGVLAGCTYYYRIHDSAEYSLSASARMKENWYFTYLDRVFMWLYRKATAQASIFPEFLQYTLYRDLYNRFNENTQCVKVLPAEDIPLYKEKLFEALRCIDDKVIRGLNVVNSDYQIYFYSIKHGCPRLEVDRGCVHFIWDEADIDISKKLSVMYENCEVKNGIVSIEGYAVINNVGFDLSSGRLRFTLNGNVEIAAEIIEGTTNDKLAFADEYVFFRKYFKLSIPVRAIKDGAINVSLVLNGEEIPFSFGGSGKWFGASADVPSSYYYEKGALLYFKDRTLCLKRASLLTKRRCERNYCRFLKEKSKISAEYKKAYRVRLLYKVASFFKLRRLWLIEDRTVAAGDNGEAFYKFLKKKPWINKYFVLSPQSEDYARLKKAGFKLLDPFSRKYKIKYLICDAVISSQLENDQIMPIKNRLNPDIVQKKKYIFLQHGVTKDDLSAVYSRKNQKINMFITSATPEYDSIVENPMYFCNGDITKLTGFPRFDSLYNKSEKKILIMPTWRRSLADHVDHSTGYWVMKPGFEKTYYYNFYRSLMTNGRLRDALSKHGYRLCYFSHANMIEFDKYFDDIDGLHIVRSDERNYNRYFAISDLLVTDYSSTAFDFAYLRKPIVYCQGDEGEFFGSHTYVKGYFDYRRDAFGEVTVTVEETVDAIIRSLENDCKLEEKYLKRVNSFFPYTDRNCCKRVYNEIIKL